MIKKIKCRLKNVLNKIILGIKKQKRLTPTAPESLRTRTPGVMNKNVHGSIVYKSTKVETPPILSTIKTDKLWYSMECDIKIKRNTL